MTLAVLETVSKATLTPRRIVRVEQTPAAEPGFIGEGHTAVEVLKKGELSASDPFVLLMDDRLELPKRRQIGGPHPHAGLETVTLVLQGNLYDRAEGELSAGDAVWMTAGRGIVHNEHVEAEGNVRVLQLWVGLPKAQRFAAPAVQLLRAAEQPTLREPGVFVRLYSGELGALRSVTKNLVPVTLAEISLEHGAHVKLEIPAKHTGFLYVLDGDVQAGADARAVGATETAWLDRLTASGSSELSLTAGPSGARAVLYAGERHEESLIQHGPFVGDSEATITRFFLEYRSGRFQRLSGI